MEQTPSLGVPTGSSGWELHCLVNEGGEGEQLAGTLALGMLGCSWYDVRTFPG